MEVLMEFLQQQQLDYKAKMRTAKVNPETISCIFMYTILVYLLCNTAAVSVSPLSPQLQLISRSSKITIMVHAECD